MVKLIIKKSLNSKIFQFKMIEIIKKFFVDQLNTGLQYVDKKKRRESDDRFVIYHAHHLENSILTRPRLLKYSFFHSYCRFKNLNRLILYVLMYIYYHIIKNKVIYY